jgi:hypothetical protein
MALFTGNIRFTSTDAAQDDNKGNVYYDDSEAQLKHYNGSNWANVNRNINYDRPGDGLYDVDGDTSLLIHSDTSNDSTTFADSSSGTTHVITRSNALHKTAQAKIGATSMYFDGDGDYLTIPAHNDWDFGTGAYTIEMWIKTAGTQQGSWLINQADSDTGIRLCIGSNGSGSGAQGLQMNEQVSNTDSIIDGTTTVNDDDWHHVVVTRAASGGSTKIYVDGTLDGTGEANKNFDNNNIMYIGTRYGHGGNYFQGYIDELRISKGIARWTSNFTVY